MVNCWNDSSIDFISDFFISSCFEVDGTDGVPESVVNGSCCWVGKRGLEITCSWLEIILEVEVIVLVFELVADRAQDCVLDDDDVALLVLVDLLELDSILVQSSILITTKGDVVETWKLILKGRIVSNDDANSVKRLVIRDSKATQSLSSSSFMKSEMFK